MTDQSTIMDQPPGHIDSLATELKTEIAKLLSPRDRQAMALVSKTWAWVTLPILWETLESDLELRDDRSLSALLKPSSNIIKHVQKLVLTTPDENPCYLPMLLNILPPGQLQGFTTHVSLKDLSLVSILRLHHLVQLQIHANEWDRLARFSWVMPRMSKLRNITIEADSLDDTEGFNLEMIGRYCTELETLSFIGYGPARLFFSSADNDYLEYLETSQSSSEEHTMASKITKLSFQGYSLFGVNSISTWIDVTRIEQLTLTKVTDIQNLFSVLTTEFAHTEARLRILHIMSSKAAPGIDFSTSLKSFLLSFQGLEELQIRCRTWETWTATAGLVNHGASLKSLFLVREVPRRWIEMSPLLPTSDLRATAAACPLLEHLCLDLCSLRGSDNILGKVAKNESEPSEFEDALSSIAQMKKLRVLRLTDPSIYWEVRKSSGYEYRKSFYRRLEAGKVCHTFQLWAERYLRYLVNHGSNISLLAFAPAEGMVPIVPSHHKQMLAQISWPNYVYSPAHRKGSRGKDIVSAELVEDWEKKFSDVAIFNDIGTY